jgi:hypothetical protein
MLQGCTARGSRGRGFALLGRQPMAGAHLTTCRYLKRPVLNQSRTSVRRKDSFPPPLTPLSRDPQLLSSNFVLSFSPLRLQETACGLGNSSGRPSITP